MVNIKKILENHLLRFSFTMFIEEKKKKGKQYYLAN